MKLAIMQPYFFPYIGYFQLINSVDKFMLYENVTFRSKGWITRNYIQQKNGESFMISIPISERSSYKTIAEIQLINFKTWNSWFYKTIFFNYKRAPFFEEICPLIKEILAHECDSLHEFNCFSIISICNHLDIKTEISTNHKSYLEMEYELQGEYNQLQNENYNNVPERKTRRIINICLKEHAETYHNAINGMNLYSSEHFSPYGIDLRFIKQRTIEYKQFNGNFVPDLSIIDVLMHCGLEETKKLLLQYTLI